MSKILIEENLEYKRRDLDVSSSDVRPLKRDYDCYITLLNQFRNEKYNPEKLYDISMFNVVDTYFASKISSIAVAAITISFPMYMMIITISRGTREGATALIANAEGSGKKNLAKKYLLQTIIIRPCRIIWGVC